MIRSLFVLVLFASPVSAADPTVAELLRQLGTGSPGERVIAAELLGERGPAALDAAPALAKTALLIQPRDDDDNLNEADQFLFDACCNALAALGPNAAATFGTVLEHDDPFTRRHTLHWFRGRPDLALGALPSLVKCLSTPNADVLERAAEAIGEIGPKAESAIPALVALFLAPPADDCSPGGPFGIFPQPRLAVVMALVKIGPKAHPAIQKDVLPRLAAELKGQQKAWDFSQPNSLVAALGELAEPLIPTLVDLARNADDADKRAVPMALLLQVGKAGRAAFAEFASDLKPDTCRAVVLALSHPRPVRIMFGPIVADRIEEAVGAFVPQILVGMRDADPLRRRVALNALQRANRLPPDAVASVLALLDDPKFVRTIAADAASSTTLPALLLNVGGDAGVKAVAACLKHPDQMVRVDAVWALGNRRSLAKSHLALLRDVARNDADPTVAAWAAIAAARVTLDPAELDAVAARPLDPKMREYVKEEASGLKSPRVPWRPPSRVPPLDLSTFLVASNWYAGNWPIAVVRLTIESCGPLALALPALLKEIGPRPADLDIRRTTAAHYLAAVGPAAKRAVPALRKLLTEPNPEVRLAAAFALARIENDLPKYRTLILRTAKHARWSGTAMEVFICFPREFPELMPRSRWELHDDRMFAAVVKCGPAAAACVPNMRFDLTSDTPSAEVVRLFAELGPIARDALPELRKLLDGDSATLAVLARDAIRKIEGK